MRLLAPAKINLHLRVGPRRADGFHPLLTWMCTVGLFDSLELRPSAQPGIALSCDRAEVPCDSANLVVRAAQALEALLERNGEGGSFHGRGVRAALHKRTPVGAGLGGGSSDGVRALLGLNRLWNAGLRLEQLALAAATLGSDLPFFLYGPSSICRGRGEDVRPTARPVCGWALLALPREGLPTAAVYRRFDEMGLGRAEDVDEAPPFEDWAALPAEVLLPRLVNDLEPAAFDIAPQLGRLRTESEAMLGRPVRMSGSGSSLFSLFDAKEPAELAANEMQRRFGVTAMAVELVPQVVDDLNEPPAKL